MLYVIPADTKKGTTETQRAVSYYEIPSHKEDPDFLDSMGDVIPAGKGMKDVSMPFNSFSFEVELKSVGSTSCCQPGILNERNASSF